MKQQKTIILTVLFLLWLSIFGAFSQTTIINNGQYITVATATDVHYIDKPFDVHASGANALTITNAFDTYSLNYDSITLPTSANLAALIEPLMQYNYDISDYWLKHSIDVIRGTYGDEVSAVLKRKDLLKFGLSDQVQTSKSTLMTLPTGTYNETYVASDLITTMSSGAVADSAIMTIEGHTVDGSGNFTFVIQSDTLQGRTQVTMSTPLARITRAYNANGTDLTGVIYWYENNTTTLGVPDTDALVHMMIRAGKNNTEKAATTISNTDYWIITGMNGSNLEKIASVANIHLEVRHKGRVFRDIADVSASATGSAGQISFKPYLIIPKNSDVRLRADADANNKEVAGSIQGVLLKVID